jgi:hypothetical protein
MVERRVVELEGVNAMLEWMDADVGEYAGG